MRNIQNLFSAVSGALMGKKGGCLDRAIEASHLRVLEYTSQPMPRL